jgi:hypothetical protein
MGFSDKLAEMLRLNDGDQAYVGYPQMQVGLNKPRQAGYATGFLEGATGMDSMQPKNPITDPNYDQYAQGKNTGELVGIGAMALPAYATALRAGAPKAYNALENYMVKTGGIIPLEAWHGTPHKIVGNFDISKVGTGEGAQAYGHGMYFAENPEVAQTYVTATNPSARSAYMHLQANNGNIAETIKEAAKDVKRMEKNQQFLVKGALEQAKEKLSFLQSQKAGSPIQTGNLYKVDIPDEHIPKTLNWYESFENQPKDVQEALRNLGPEITFGSGKESVADWLKTTGNLPPHLTKQSGHGIYSELSKQLGGDKQASEYLNNLGIKGIQYENFQIKKGQGGGTNNYVMFEPSDVKILEENGIPTRKELIQQQVDKLE